MERIGFNKHGNLEEAREIATEVLKKYADFDEVTYSRFINDGIWNDDAAVQAALTALDKYKKNE